MYKSQNIKPVNLIFWVLFILLLFGLSCNNIPAKNWKAHLESTRPVQLCRIRRKRNFHGYKESSSIPHVLHGSKITHNSWNKLRHVDEKPGKEDLVGSIVASRMVSSNLL